MAVFGAKMAILAFLIVYDSENRFNWEFLKIWKMLNPPGGDFDGFRGVKWMFLGKVGYY